MVLFIFIQILIEQSVSPSDQGRTGCLCPTELALGLYGLKHLWGRGGCGSQRTKPSQLNRRTSLAEQLLLDRGGGGVRTSIPKEI